MKPVTVHRKSQVIVYDADVLPSADRDLFELEHWQRAGALLGSAPGRGSTHFVRTVSGPAALRHYLRGGWARRFSRDRYLYLGAARSRPFLEFHLLRRMTEAGLRVPEPLAALCNRETPWYRGALLTRRIEAARPLTECFDDPQLDWARLGAGLREFHDAGVRHADLNARNVLLHAERGAVWLVDFDRSRFSPGSPVDGRRSLARLKRSLDKLWPGPAAGLQDRWRALLRGYGGPGK